MMIFLWEKQIHWLISRRPAPTNADFISGRWYRGEPACPVEFFVEEERSEFNWGLPRGISCLIFHWGG